MFFHIFEKNHKTYNNATKYIKKMFSDLKEKHLFDL